MKRWKVKIFNSGLLKSLTLRLRKTRLEKQRVPLLRVLQVLYKQLLETNIHQQASSIAFSFVMSFFPAMLFLFTLIPYIASFLPIPNPTDTVRELLKNGLPIGIYDFIAPTLLDIIENPRADLLSFGFLFALYAATSGVVEMMDTFNKNYQFSEKRSFLYKRFIAILLAFLFAFLLIVAVIMLIVGDIVISQMQENQWINAYLSHYFAGFLRYVVVFLVFYFGISVIYYEAPAVSKQWRFFSSGSTIASVFIILSTYAFSYYLINFATYNKLYGSIGTLIALMVWFYLLAWILLLGFELNASIAEARVAHEKEIDMKHELLDEFDITKE